MDLDLFTHQQAAAAIEAGAITLLGVSVVKNESDIIEYFVRYNLCYVDALVVIDNGSTDTTPDILVRLQKEGLPLLLLHDDQPGHFQSRRMQHVCRMAAEQLAPVFLLPLDADEFVLAPNRRALLDALRTLPAGSAGMLRWKTYVPTLQDDPSVLNPLKRIRHRRRDEKGWYDKVVVPAELLHDPKVKIREGNHGLMSPAADIPHHNLQDIRLAHYPVRSEQQIRSKILTGWLGIQMNSEREGGGAFHWEQMFHRLKDRWSISGTELQDLASGYSDIDMHDIVFEPLPLPAGFEAHYDGLVHVNAWSNLVGLIEKIASSCVNSAAAARSWQEILEALARVGGQFGDDGYNRRALLDEIEGLVLACSRRAPAPVLESASSENRVGTVLA